jgi:hypothetical protein
MSREILEKAMGDCFAHLGVTVTYSGANISPAEIVVLKTASDLEYQTGDSVYVGNAAKFEILIRDIERPLAGDTINIDGTIYQIFGEPVRKLELKTWEVDALVMA